VGGVGWALFVGVGMRDGFARGGFGVGGCLRFGCLIGNWDRGGERLDGCGVLRAGSGMILWEVYSQQGLCCS